MFLLKQTTSRRQLLIEVFMPPELLRLNQLLLPTLRIVTLIDFKKAQIKIPPDNRTPKVIAYN
jgi:hypothetical protein